MDGRIMRMMLRTSAGTVLTLAVMVPFVAGCSNLSQTQRGAIIGAAGGGAVGAVVGNATGSTARGAIIGAAVGGAAGAIIGRQMEKQAEELAADLENAKVEQVGEGVLVTFDSGLLFDFDSDVIKGAAADNLRTLANSLKKYPESELLIVGHTDSQGGDAYNMGLSERRAASARNYLINLGVDPSRIRTTGRGEAEPVASNESEAGRALNRRVEVAIFASEEYRQQLLRQNPSR
ncbi:MAG: OmpA family protein [Candidatus Cloacimonetes bacterium]|nr:OmpA family protein [Candidatus Cloacimonadota bacterium]